MDYKQVAEDLIKKHTLFLGTTDSGDEVWTDPLDAMIHSELEIKGIISEYQKISDLESTLIIDGEIHSVISKIQNWNQVKNELNEIARSLTLNYDGK